MVGLALGVASSFIDNSCGRQSDKTWSLVRHHLARKEPLASS